MHAWAWSWLWWWASIAAPLTTEDGAQAPEALSPPPHRIIGNIYNVGEAGLPAFAISTGAGWILLDTGYQYHSPNRILASLRQMRIVPDQIKLILNTHAHRDHAGGNAQMRRSSGARLLAMEGDAEAIAAGGAGRFRWEPAPVDGVLRDGDRVTLGGVTLTAHRVPGHTPGATAWTLQVFDGPGRYDVLILDSTWNLNGLEFIDNTQYPGIAEDYRRSLARLMQLPCDVLLDPHGGFYLRLRERLAGNPWQGSTNPFGDPQGCRDLLTRKAQALEERIAQQARRVTPPNAGTDPR